MTAPAVSPRPDVRDAARQYISRGLQVVPLTKDTKEAYTQDWIRLVFKPEDFRPDDNLGIRSVNGLVDVDCDATEVVQLAPKLLPPTGAAYGRPSKPRAHWLYRSDFPESVAYRDLSASGDQKASLIEIRVNHQSMAPPSVHPDDHEVLSWDPAPMGEIVAVASESLHRAVQVLATAALVARYYSAPGSRHSWCLAVAGLLRRVGVSAEEAEKIIVSAAESAGDLETSNRRDTVRTTFSRGDEEPITAAGGLKDLMLNAKAFTRSIRSIWQDPADSNDCVVMRGGHLSAIVDKAEDALLAFPIYQRGGMLTRAVRLDKTTGDASTVLRHAGSVMLVAVREPWLLEQMSRALRWYRCDKDGERTLADPKSIYARTLLHRGEWRFPVLRNVISAPTLAPDGRIIEAPGFDAVSGLLLDVPENTFPPVPVAPTRADALAALARLEEPLRGFPFVDDGARSVALSLLLTGLVRSSLRTAPLHGIDAPTAGTGKSLLAEMAGLLATGVRPAAMSQGKTIEEDEKRLSTVLFAGDPVIHIDNCERAISGDFLCSMLTQEVVQARILGYSERRVLPCTALVVATGNNLIFAGDAARRAIKCRLDAKVERPDTRCFDFDCHAEVVGSRPELVVAGLTVLRAYKLSGGPVRLRPMGSFSDWEWIRGALVWLDRADPEVTREDILDTDLRRDELLAVMDLWQQALGDSHIEVGDIAKRADRGTDAAVMALRDKLIEVACHAGRWSSKSVGWWLRRHKDRVTGGRCLRCEQQREGHHVWYLAVDSGGLFDDP